MTPLAHMIVRELTLPIKRRSFEDLCQLLPRMRDIHCFEVSNVFDMAADLCVNNSMLGPAAMNSDLAFLPAPKTWIEWRRGEHGNEREGVLLEQTADGRAAWCTWAFKGAGLFRSQAKHHRFAIGLGDEVVAMKVADKAGVARWLSGETEAQARGWTALVYALLALINTPRVIGRRQHMPHAGLERRLLQMKGIVGKFPLHAWTEITLECKPPDDMSDMPGYEARLTGMKCLHFCRAHLRIRRGRVEFVSSHWRGNPALGMKQSRYRVMP